MVGELAEALACVPREPVQGLQKALAALGDLFDEVVEEVFHAASLLHSLEKLQITGAVEIIQEFRPTAGCHGWKFLASAQEHEK